MQLILIILGVYGNRWPKCGHILKQIETFYFRTF